MNNDKVNRWLKIGATSNLVIEEGSDFGVSFTWEVDGEPKDLDGWTSKFVVRKDFDLEETPFFEWSTSDFIVIDGSEVSLGVPASEISSLPFEEDAVYEWKVYSPTGGVRRIVKGRVFNSNTLIDEDE